MDLELFGLGHGFGSVFVSFHQIPLLIGTFYGIIMSLSLENSFRFFGFGLVFSFYYPWIWNLN